MLEILCWTLTSTVGRLIGLASNQVKGGRKLQGHVSGAHRWTPDNSGLQVGWKREKIQILAVRSGSEQEVPWAECG